MYGTSTEILKDFQNSLTFTFCSRKNQRKPSDLNHEVIAKKLRFDCYARGKFVPFQTNFQEKFRNWRTKVTKKTKIALHLFLKIITRRPVFYNCSQPSTFHTKSTMVLQKSLARKDSFAEILPENRTPFWQKYFAKSSLFTTYSGGKILLKITDIKQKTTIIQMQVLEWNYAQMK